MAHVTWPTRSEVVLNLVSVGVGFGVIFGEGSQFSGS